MAQQFKTIIDTHTHTDSSFDGHHSPMYMCETAVTKGVRAIAFTDHCEVDAFYTDKFQRNVYQAFFEIAKAKDAFCGNILVLNGIELGESIYDIPTAEKILACRKFDVVIGSIHNLRNRQDFYYTKDFTGIDIKATLNEYFDEIINMLEWGKIDVVAHLTYPFRYLYSRNQIEPDLNDYREKIDTILTLIRDKDKALEINSAGLRQKIGKLSPESGVVKRFKELGGKYVSVGSDAHYAADIAAGIPEAYECALSAGFTSTVIFENRCPLEIPIE